MVPVSPEWQLLFERAYAHHKATGEWPTAVTLQRELANSHPGFMVRDVVHGARGYAGINAPDDEVQLTLRALVHVPAARPVLQGYLLAVRAMIDRFRDQSKVPRYSMHDLAALDVAPEVRVELQWLLEMDRWPFGSGNGSGPDGQAWEYDIDDRVMAAANVNSVEELVAVRYNEPFEQEESAPAFDLLLGTPGGEPQVNPDRPISRPGDDLLDRMPLARALALQAVTQPHNEGFVMGVSGPWGSGKTSVLNLMTNAIEARSAAHVLRFDPWMFSSSEELVMRFLREMAKQMIQEPRLKGVADQIASYAEVLAPLAVLAPGPWLAPVIAASGRARGLWYRRKKTPSALEQRDRVREALLELTSGSLSSSMTSIGYKSRARDVVRLVKLVGDFPNTTYVLAYDQRRIAAALGDTEHEGNEFLETSSS